MTTTPCQESPMFFDWEIDGAREPWRLQRARLADAQTLCLTDCPVLAECAATKHAGAVGVIAGQIVRPETHQAFWPVVDDTRTMRELIREALAELPDMLKAAGLRADGPEEWTISEGIWANEPGATRALCLSVPAVRESELAHIARDVDPVAVDRACDGDRVTLNPAERAQGVRRLVRRGMTDRQIADTLDTNVRTVLRIRQRHGITAAVESNGSGRRAS